ncbi:MAG: hypothetical protein OXI54_03785 [Chloroflexota bacterium]|nr:hypothetical protein [Chloroflexota bacterium]MDE2683253.1 hypothetical protein [Chloroflexota bacterium]
MSAPKMEMTPLEYVDASKREQAAGNHIKAAALMWQATQATFAALAAAHGVKYSGLDDVDLFAIADALEAGGVVRKRYYRSGIAPGSLLKDHANMEVLEDYQLELAYETAEQFIRECLDGH